MDTVEHYSDIIERTLCDRARFYSAKDGPRTFMAFDRERGQFILIDEGWDGYRRVHSVWAHVELLDGKILIHEDGAEEGIANLLVGAGIPRDRIVLAFHSPSQRLAGEFAAA